MKMNVCAVKQRSKAVLGSVMGLLVLSLLVLGCPVSRTCSSAYPPGDHQIVTLWGEYDAATRRVVFEITGDCPVLPEDAKTCGCEWHIDTLSFGAKPEDSLVLEGRHVVELRIPDGNDWIDRNVTLDLTGSTAATTGLVAADHTQLTIELPGGFKGDSLYLKAGSLCVVVNIEGGSGNTR